MAKERYSLLADRLKQRHELAKKLETQACAKKERAEFEDVAKGKVDPNEAGWEGVGQRNSVYRLPERFEDLGIRGSLCLMALAEQRRKSSPFHGKSIGQILSDKFKRSDIAKIYDETRSYNSANPEDGGMFIMPVYLAQEFVPLLRSLCPVFALGARRLPMNKDQAFYRGQTSGATAEWVGELETSGASQAGFNDVRLNAKKLMAKCYGSNDLLDDADSDVLEMFRDDLIAAMITVITKGAIYNEGGDASPKGLLRYPIQRVNLNAQLTPKTFSHGNRLLKKKLIPAQRGNCGWLMGPDLEQVISTMQTTTGHFIFQESMDAGRLWGSAYEVWDDMPTVDNTAPTLDTTSLIYGDWRELIVGISKEMEVEIDDRATFDVGGKKVDAWDIDAFVVRAKMKMDFGVRRPDAFVEFENVHIPAIS